MARYRQVMMMTNTVIGFWFWKFSRIFLLLGWISSLWSLLEAENAALEIPPALAEASLCILVRFAQHLFYLMGLLLHPASSHIILCGWIHLWFVFIDYIIGTVKTSTPQISINDTWNLFLLEIQLFEIGDYVYRRHLQKYRHSTGLSKIRLG